MPFLKYRGRQAEEPREIPDTEELERLLHEGLHQEFVRRILEWKGEASYEYFQNQWDLRLHEIKEAAESLEDVEIKNRRTV